MLQRSLLIVTALILLLITAVLLLADTNNSDDQAVVEETDYLSPDADYASIRQPAIHTTTPIYDTAYDNGTISIISGGQLEEIANQGIPPEKIELDYGDAALTYPNYP